MDSDGSSNSSLLESSSSTDTNEPTPQNVDVVRRTLTLNAVALFVAESARGLFLSSLFSYISSFKSSPSDAVAALALAVSCFSWGRLLAAFLLPVAITRGHSYRTVLVVSCLIQAVGHAMFLLPAFRTVDSQGAALIITSRAFVGFGSGTLSIARAVVSEISTIDDRATAMAWLSFAKYAGYALCPGVGIVLAYANAGPLFNSFTAPATVSIALVLATTVGLQLWFMPDLAQTTTAPMPREALREPFKGASAFTATSLANTVSDGVRGIWSALWAAASDAVLQALVLFVWLNFTTKGILAVAESSIAPQYADTFGPNGDEDLDQDTAELALGLGVAGLLTYVVMALKPKPGGRTTTSATANPREDSWRSTIPRWLARAGFGSKGADVWLMLSCLGLTSIGLLLMTPIHGSPATLPSLASGLVFVWSITAPVLDVLTVSCFSVLCSTVRPGAGQSTYMGYLSAAGAVGRIAFAALVSAASLSSALIVCQIAVVLGLGLTAAYYGARGELPLKWATRIPMYR